LALGRGDLKAIKYGTRIPIDVEAGLAWLASMPQACITTGQHYSLAESKLRYSLKVPELLNPRMSSACHSVLIPRPISSLRYRPILAAARRAFSSSPKLKCKRNYSQAAPLIRRCNGTVGGVSRGSKPKLGRNRDKGLRLPKYRIRPSVRDNPQGRVSYDVSLRLSPHVPSFSARSCSASCR
jgi:hypothetical protein